MKKPKFLIWSFLVVCLGILGISAGCQKLEDPSTPARPPTQAGIVENTGPTAENPQPELSSSYIFDPLTNGTSVGTVSGGTFTSEGFRVNSDYGEYLAYSTSITVNIQVEFDAQGYSTYEGEKMIVIEIFDSPHEVSWLGGSSAWETYDLYQIKKVDERIRLKAGGKGSWGGGYVGSFGWDANTTYHWVITIQDGYTEVTRNGEMVVSESIPEFQPFAPLNIRIGGSWCDSGSAGVTYSNVSISGM